MGTGSIEPQKVFTCPNDQCQHYGQGTFAVKCECGVETVLMGNLVSTERMLDDGRVVLLHYYNDGNHAVPPAMTCPPKP